MTRCREQLRTLLWNEQLYSREIGFVSPDISRQDRYLADGGVRSDEVGKHPGFGSACAAIVRKDLGCEKKGFFRNTFRFEACTGEKFIKRFNGS
jgi:hypothetical protein